MWSTDERMNAFTKFAAGLVALTLVGDVPIKAEERSPYFMSHVRLAEAIEKTGTDFQLNPPQCNSESNTYGWYYAGDNQLVVCQENAKYHNWNEVEWTEEDLDTLRHEAHHLVQDCMDGHLQGRLDTVYEDWEGLAKEVLGYDKIARILEVYDDYEPRRQVMELEAFSVASLDDPEEQILDIQRYCM